MTGFMSSKFRHCCEADGCYNATLPNWDSLLEGVFPRNIWPTDVDGYVEINDHFLFMEQKGTGVPLPEGQRRALLRLSTRERVTILFFRPKDLGYEVLIYGEGEPDGWQPRTKQWLTDWLHTWAHRADALQRT